MLIRAAWGETSLNDRIPGLKRILQQTFPKLNSPIVIRFDQTRGNGRKNQKWGLFFSKHLGGSDSLNTKNLLLSKLLTFVQPTAFQAICQAIHRPVLNNNVLCCSRMIIRSLFNKRLTNSSSTNLLSLTVQNETRKTIQLVLLRQKFIYLLLQRSQR